ncbi:hypothetical protein [Parasediminibacterium sp. JCM 36343]|uniref:hypothetical protein n=1 Tax=Parasediminibacterium sp. JCM 36343 TaxID=3374279 RepID=UPI00397A4564
MKKEMQIEKRLREALLEDGEMSYGLYEFELVEHIDYWKEGMYKDKDEFVFIVTENRGDIAMLLITKENDIFINEQARAQLQLFWKKEAYIHNMNILIPQMAAQIADGIIAVNGVKTV